MSEFLKGSDRLMQSIAELKVNLFSPEAITKFWKAKLQADGKRIGLDISVLDCNWTKREMRKPMIGINGAEVPSMMVYIPQELYGQEGLIKLGQMYPKMNIWPVQKETVAWVMRDSPDSSKKGRWIKVEATIDAPNINTTEKDLKNHAKAKKYSRQRLITYIFASQASKDLTGHYLDEESTWSRLGTHFQSEVAYVRFHSDGDLTIPWPLDPQAHGAGIGGRFEEVKKA
ncbi:MAG: hypothetical protein A3H17_02640 [Candidatus Levybacteria bacterium RIFCSPLOWO2_12_FULL_37_14]|nr:MAG: hypothetical protein US59_C0030G0005 [Candidatus Levybacteria bacterium GW2011_GWB1_37_8]OGH51349.1 MAG: hypothetical protein A3H17_02640 [Candidatus Levybacteria bacterium RIFCSPLOWO2_12_FULL_37_14]